MISQHALFRARALKAHYAIFNKKNALDADTNDTPVVRAGEISKDQATSDETPAWFEPSQPIPSENIRYPHEPISPSEKIYYEACKKYYHMTGKPLIAISSRDDIELASSRRIRLGIDEDYNTFDLEEYLNKFCQILNINRNDVDILKVQSGSVLAEIQIQTRVNLQMVYNNISKPEAEERMGKMKIFFCFFGDLAKMDQNVEFRNNVKLNGDWNRIYYQGHTYWTGALNSHRNRGSKPYYCPVGWRRYSLFMKNTGTDNGRTGRCICYHGTKFEYGLAILLSGLKPASAAEHGPGVYFSPSINYASHPRYSEIKKIPLEYQNSFSQSGKYIQFVLECRVQPSKIISIQKETLRATDVSNPNVIDPNIKDSEIEWVVSIKHDDREIVDFDDPNSAITCSGLMVRVTNNHPSLLSESQWWHTSHLCANNRCCCLNADLTDLKTQKKNGVTCSVVFD
ncbi:unnamed protein product [Rotaria socialis]|uniref:Uncharacterized protein n=1 Tax=Rotaria socialis TaxID=392032 RepID=A0A818Z8R5_9BILA|nr:unnamed protein product [Rotaria socialis]